jgi:four helix bundle protein
MERQQLTPEILRKRTKQFAIRIVRLSNSLPNSREADVMGKQVLRSGTSVGANYRAACRARSKPDFISKLGIVLEEADETVFWLELLIECGMVKEEKLTGLLNEARELMTIFAAAHQTARKTRKRQYS